MQCKFQLITLENWRISNFPASKLKSLKLNNLKLEVLKYIPFQIENLVDYITFWIEVFLFLREKYQDKIKLNPLITLFFFNFLKLFHIYVS